MKIDIHSDPPTSEQVTATKDKEKFRRKFILRFLMFGMLLWLIVWLFFVLTAEDMVALVPVVKYGFFPFFLGFGILYSIFLAVENGDK
jgi:hypothetical protein